MPRITVRSASAKQIAQDKRTINHVQDIKTVNKQAKLGSVSARFYRTGKVGFYPKSTELTPEQALIELMAGHTVEATPMTWRKYTSRNKMGATSTRKVRSKVRNAKKQKFTDVGSFEKWWTKVSDDVAHVAKQPKNTTTRTRTRSSKGW